MRVPVQCQGMMTFAELARAATDRPEPFTDRLRLAVAAYIPGPLQGLLPRAHRIRPALLPVPGAPGAVWTRWRPAAAPGAVYPLDEGDPRFKPSTTSRRFSVGAGFYRTCLIDGLMQHSPAEQVRHPGVPAESPTLGFTHLQFEALLTAAAIVSAGCRLSVRVSVTFRTSAPAGPDRASCPGRGSSSSLSACRPDVGDRGGSAAQRTGNQVTGGKQPSRSPAQAQLPDRRRVDPVVADEDH